MSDARKPGDQLTGEGIGAIADQCGLARPRMRRGRPTSPSLRAWRPCAQPPLAPLVAAGQALHLPRLAHRMPSAHGACDTLRDILAI